VGFEPTISAGKRPQTYACTARPLGPAEYVISVNFCRREVVQVITSVLRGNVYSIPVFLYLPGNSITGPLITKFGGPQKWSRCRVSIGNRTRVVDSHIVDPLPAHSFRAVLQERNNPNVITSLFKIICFSVISATLLVSYVRASRSPNLLLLLILPAACRSEMAQVLLLRLFQIYLFYCL